MTTDIRTRTDLRKIVDLFYEKLFADETMNPIFTEVAKIDLEEHLPILVDFWEGIIFQSGNYRRNAMEPHLVLHDKFPLKKIHFELWLNYFNNSVDELFAGEKAELAKARAKSIAMIMEIKVNQMPPL